MLFKQHVLQGIEAGTITLAFRRWKRPSVKAGGTLLTPAGLLNITSVEPIDESDITAAQARRAGFDSVDQLIASLGSRGGQLYRICFERAGEAPRIALREDADLSDTDLETLQKRLQRLDERSRIGPWTFDVLQLIGRYPEQRAADLAASSDYEKEWLKANIRKLKNLGLTESLTIGYRLSPRGRHYLRCVTGRGSGNESSPQRKGDTR